MKLKIVKRVEKPFKSDDGETRPYFWYTALKDDGFAINFGSSEGGLEVGETEDIFLEQYDRRDGKTGYRQVI